MDTHSDIEDPTFGILSPKFHNDTEETDESVEIINTIIIDSNLNVEVK